MARDDVDYRDAAVSKYQCIVVGSGFLITTAVPSIVANIIGHTTNYFDDEYFEAAVGVNLTILLVLTTM